jgi:hypothetical protein
MTSTSRRAIPRVREDDDDGPSSARSETAELPRMPHRSDSWWETVKHKRESRIPGMGGLG